MRRLLKSIANREKIGDISTLEDGAAVEEVESAFQELQSTINKNNQEWHVCHTVMIKLGVKGDVKNVKNCFMYLKLANFVLNVPDWNQENKGILKFISPYYHIVIWGME